MADELTGIALNIEVATKVMGQTRSGDCPLSNECPGQYSPLLKHAQHPCLPDYSTDIRAAWQVVEAINEGHDVNVWQDHADGKLWRATFSMDMAVVATAMAPTAAEAICRAALKAVAND